jgi:hypothetical protein
MKQRVLLLVFIFVVSATAQKQIILDGITQLGSGYVTLNDKAYFFAVSKASSFAQIYSTNGSAATQIGTIDRGSLAGAGSVSVDNNFSPALRGNRLYTSMYDYTAAKNLIWIVSGGANDPIKVADSSEYYTYSRSAPDFEFNGRVYILSTTNGLISFDMDLQDRKTIDQAISSLTILERRSDALIVILTNGVYSFDGAQFTPLVTGTIGTINVFGSDIFYTQLNTNGDTILYRSTGPSSTPVALTTPTLVNCKVSSFNPCFDAKVVKLSATVYIFTANGMVLVTDGVSANNTKQIQTAGNYGQQIFSNSTKAMFVSFSKTGSTRVLYCTDGSTTTEIRTTQTGYAIISNVIGSDGSFIFRDDVGLWKTDCTTAGTSVIHVAAQGALEKTVTLSNGETQYYIYDSHKIPKGPSFSRIYVTNAKAALLFVDLDPSGDYIYNNNHVYLKNSLIWEERNITDTNPITTKVYAQALPTDSVTYDAIPVCGGDTCAPTPAPQATGDNRNGAALSEIGMHVLLLVAALLYVAM